MKTPPPAREQRESALAALLSYSRYGALLSSERDRITALFQQVIVEGDEQARRYRGAWRSARRRAAATDVRHRAARLNVYDAFAAVYRERAHLIAYLAALHPSHISPTDPDAPNWPVLTVETPAGQMSWHIETADVELFGHVAPTGPEHRPWDGHTMDEKYGRLNALALTHVRDGTRQSAEEDA